MEIEKTMQFILETQAKHEVTIQAILETQAKHGVTIQAILETQAKSGERFLRFQQDVGQRFSTLVDVSLSLARHGEETDRRIRELTETQASTDGKLNALIDTVDRLVKRNGSRE